MQKPDFRCGFVALFGRPNVGKSSLLNHLVGEKIAAVSPKAQTTRRRFRGIRTDEESQIIFVDTPGIHRAPEGVNLNEFCVSEALDAIADSDIYVYLIDGSRPFDPSRTEGDEYFVLETIRALLQKKSKPFFVLLTKKDIWEKGETKFADQNVLQEALSSLPEHKFIPISVKTEDGIPELLAAMKAVLPVGPPLYPEDELTDKSQREVVAEIIQEKLFYFLGEELPYSCAVEIEKYTEPTGDKKMPEILATIHVERESQKPMVIGKGGAKIKEIGQSARESVEQLLGGRVVLRLFVKVTEKWTKNPNQLKRFGYALGKKPEAR